MRKSHGDQGNLPKSGCKLTLPALSDNKSLSLSRPQLQRDQMLNQEELYLTPQGADISKVPRAFRNTMEHLKSRHMEVSYWQTLIYESIHLVDREMAYVEQVKEMIEHCLHERKVYSQLLGHCLALSSRLGSASLNQDQLFIQLKKEERLTHENREVLQKQIFILLNKLSSLRTMRSSLKKDFQDKIEAIKLTTRCIAFEMTTPCSDLPASPLKPIYVSHEQWLSHCQYLKMMADNLVWDSSKYRRKLQFLLANLKDSSERQRCSTDESLRRKIHDLTVISDRLDMDKQRMKLEISDLTKNVQRVASHIKNCEIRLHHTFHLLDIYNQRPRYELCLDRPHTLLALEKQDLTKMVDSLQSEMQRSKENIGIAHQRLTFVEDKLARNAQTLEMAQRCRNIHQSFPQAVNAAVALSNKPSLQAVLNSSSTPNDLQ